MSIWPLYSLLSPTGTFCTVIVTKISISYAKNFVMYSLAA
uniref:Uncharacterized protein n=1 Tax=Arundo donax TaxID=35708 RepID=A0A0A8ZM57_ARUDO